MRNADQLVALQREYIANAKRLVALAVAQREQLAKWIAMIERDEGSDAADGH